MNKAPSLLLWNMQSVGWGCRAHATTTCSVMACVTGCAERARGVRRKCAQLNFEEAGKKEKVHWRPEGLAEVGQVRRGGKAS